MLYAVTGKLMNRHHQDDPVLQNALLESFGIHNRNLIDFLWLEVPMQRTDAIARDWIERWEAPAMSERLANVKDRVGKEMVHLSYKRLDVSEDAKGWTVLGIGPEVIGAFVKFATEVPADVVPEGWRDRAYAATGAIPPERVQDLEQYLIRPEDLPAAHSSVSPDTGASGEIQPPNRRSANAVLGFDPRVTAGAERHEVRGGICPALAPRIDVVRCKIGVQGSAFTQTPSRRDDLAG